MVADVVSLVGGLLLLVGAATLLVRGAAALALRLGLTPLVVGLTVVAFGTSAPELVVSVRAALDGAGGIAIGNVVGSNIANVGLVLGVAVLIRPILADPSLFHRDLPTLLGVTVLASAFLSLCTGLSLASSPLKCAPKDGPKRDRRTIAMYPTHGNH